MLCDWLTAVFERLPCANWLMSVIISVKLMNDVMVFLAGR